MDQSRDRDAGALFEPGDAVGEQVRVAPELVDDEALDQLSFIGFQQLQRAHQEGENAAAVDVAAEQHRSVGVAGHTHINDLILLEVDLSRTAGTLGHDYVEVLTQSVQRRVHGFPELGFQAEVVSCFGCQQRMAHDHYLGDVVGLGLQ